MTKKYSVIINLKELQKVNWQLKAVEKIVESIVGTAFKLLTDDQVDSKSDLQVVVGIVSLEEVPREGFKLVGFGDNLEITTSSLSGLFYGLSEVAKGFTNTINTEFRPLQKERSLMIDIGRKFYSQEWLMALIDFMASLRMNTLQLHFSENEGFRIESETFPEIVSPEHLTKKEIRELIDYAQERFIQVIPELDSPGHLKTLLTAYPEWRLARVGEYDPYLDHRALDITQPEAVTAIKKLLTEYFELFQDSQYFHIGADEFVEFDKLEKYPKLQQKAREIYGPEATGIELYIAYTNELIDFVKQHGFQARVWNDGFYRLDQPSLVELSRDVQITYWTKWHPQMASVRDFLDKGHQIINFNDNLFYFVLGEAAGYKYPTAEKILAEWTPVNFAQQQVLTQEELKAVMGTSFAIWSDLPEALSTTEVYQKIRDPLRALAAKSWEIISS